MRNASQRVLFVGNSFTNRNKLAKRVCLLGESATPPVSFAVESETVPLSSLKQHWEDGRVEKLIRKGRWQTVVLQEHRDGPLNDEDEAEMRKYATEFNTVIRATGAATMLFMTWPLKDRPQDIRTIARVYESLGCELRAEVAPVGLAWQQARKSRINLYVRDRWHPNTKGTYLAALVFFAKLTGQSPLGLSTAGFRIKPHQVKILQQIADSVT